MRGPRRSCRRGRASCHSTSCCQVIARSDVPRSDQARILEARPRHGSPTRSRTSRSVDLRLDLAEVPARERRRCRDRRARAVEPQAADRSGRRSSCPAGSGRRVTPTSPTSTICDAPSIGSANALRRGHLRLPDVVTIPALHDLIEAEDAPSWSQRVSVGSAPDRHVGNGTPGALSGNSACSSGRERREQQLDVVELRAVCPGGSRPHPAARCRSCRAAC